MGSSAETETATVILAFDGSPAARRALADAARILGSCRILVVTVWEDSLAYAGPSAGSAYDVGEDAMVTTPTVDPGVALEVDHELHDQAEQVSHEGAALARSLGLDAYPLALPNSGKIARTLLEVAREQRAAAIVVGSRGLGRVRARLEGSTSKDLLKDASCPVLVVHERDDDR
jgi:nucleotide-binding universal stress UspA family protein